MLLHLNLIESSQSTENHSLDPKVSIPRQMPSLLLSVKILPMICKLPFGFQKIRTVIHVQSFSGSGIILMTLGSTRELVSLVRQTDTWQKPCQAFLPLGLMKGSLAPEVPSIFPPVLAIYYLVSYNPHRVTCIFRYALEGKMMLSLPTKLLFHCFVEGF